MLHIEYDHCAFLYFRGVGNKMLEKVAVKIMAGIRICCLALQLHFLLTSESMGFHDSEVMDDRFIDRGDA